MFTTNDDIRAAFHELLAEGVLDPDTGELHAPPTDDELLDLAAEYAPPPPTDAEFAELAAALAPELVPTEPVRPRNTAGSVGNTLKGLLTFAVLIATVTTITAVTCLCRSDGSAGRWSQFVWRRASICLDFVQSGATKAMALHHAPAALAGGVLNPAECGFLDNNLRTHGGKRTSDDVFWQPMPQKPSDAGTLPPLTPASAHVNRTAAESVSIDSYGHGTHCAGTIAGFDELLARPIPRRETPDAACAAMSTALADIRVDWRPSATPSRMTRLKASDRPQTRLVAVATHSAFADVPTNQRPPGDAAIEPLRSAEECRYVLDRVGAVSVEWKQALEEIRLGFVAESDSPPSDLVRWEFTYSRASADPVKGAMLTSGHAGLRGVHSGGGVWLSPDLAETDFEFASRCTTHDTASVHGFIALHPTPKAGGTKWAGTRDIRRKSLPTGKCTGVAIQYVRRSELSPDDASLLEATRAEQTPAASPPEVRNRSTDGERAPGRAV